MCWGDWTQHLKMFPQKYKQITKSGGGAKNRGLVIGHPADLQQEGRWDDFFSTWSGPR